MIRCTVDTNVPIVANGGVGRKKSDKVPSADCRIAAIEFLMRVVEEGRVVVDVDGAIQKEYRTYLNPKGQPGVGDRFYQVILHSAPRLVERIDLPALSTGEYVDFPSDVALAKFDRSDRKFAALSRKEGIPVINATDSDWLIHAPALQSNGINVTFICGCKQIDWYKNHQKT